MALPFALISEPRAARNRTRSRTARRLSAAPALALALALAGCSPAADTQQPAASGQESGGERTVKAPLGPDAFVSRLAEIRRGGDDLARIAALSELVRNIDERSAPILRKEIIDRSSTWRPFDRLVLLSAWAEFSGKEATRWAAHSAPKPYRGIALELAMASFARTNADAAVDLFKREYGGDTAAISGLVAGWLESKPEGLQTFIESIDFDSDTAQHAIAVYARRRIERDGVEATAEWAEARGAEWDSRRTRSLYRQVASELTMFDPASGVAFCARHCDGESGGGVRQMVATRWSQRDPQSTMDWLVENNSANPEERKFAANVAYGNWIRSAPRLALDWAITQNPSLRDEEWFEPVVRRVARSLGWQRAEEALTWAESISRKAERERAKTFILKRWRARDADSAEDWITSSSLSESAKEEIRKSSEEAGAGA